MAQIEWPGSLRPQEAIHRTLCQQEACHVEEDVFLHYSCCPDGTVPHLSRATRMFVCAVILGVIPQ